LTAAVNSGLLLPILDTNTEYYAYCGKYLLGSEDSLNLTFTTSFENEGVDGRYDRRDREALAKLYGDKYNLLANRLPSQLNDQGQYIYQNSENNGTEVRNDLPIVTLKITGGKTDEKSRYGKESESEELSLGDNKIFFYRTPAAVDGKETSAIEVKRSAETKKRLSINDPVFFYCGKFKTMRVTKSDEILPDVTYVFENGEITYSPFFPGIHGFWYKTPETPKKPGIIHRGLNYLTGKKNGGRRYKTKRLKRRKHRKTARRRPKY